MSVENKGVILKPGDIVILSHDKNEIEWVIMRHEANGDFGMDKATLRKEIFIPNGMVVYHYPKPDNVIWLFIQRIQRDLKKAAQM